MQLTPNAAKCSLLQSSLLCTALRCRIAPGPTQRDDTQLASGEPDRRLRATAFGKTASDYERQTCEGHPDVIIIIGRITRLVKPV